MPLTKEIARLCHWEQLRHTGGARLLLTALRQTYWIEQGLGAAKETIRQCAHCQVQKIHEIPYQTSPLHSSRHNAVRPFSHIGVDMFGPMETTMGRGRARAKRYGIIFTCSFTRAINVEVAHDASSTSCLMAFKRHAATYGQPLHINSDRGTNFQQVRTILGEMASAWEDAQPLIQENYPSIEWTMNPPRTPSFGGHFESLIKVIKTAFKTLVKWPRYLLTDEELNTGLKEAAAMANMRPLTELSEDPSDLSPLTPSDFLNAPTLGLIPNWTEKNYFRQARTDLDELKQEIWERMRNDILTNLHKLQQAQSSKPLRVGEIVLLRTQEWRADQWPLARVIETFPGEDNEIRVVKLRYLGKVDEKKMVKESVQSVKNVFRIRIPRAIRNERML